jgi:hypothetical protein
VCERANQRELTAWCDGYLRQYGDSWTQHSDHWTQVAFITHLHDNPEENLRDPIYNKSYKIKYYPNPKPKVINYRAHIFYYPSHILEKGDYLHIEPRRRRYLNGLTKRQWIFAKLKEATEAYNNFTDKP